MRLQIQQQKHGDKVKLDFEVSKMYPVWRQHACRFQIATTISNA
jgi:hypothetical protein